MKSISTKLLITITLVSISLLMFSQNTKDVDLSITKIFPAVQGNIPNSDIDDTDYPFYGGFKYVPKHIIQGFTNIGLPVNHPGSEAIDFDWQLTLTKNPDGASSIVFDQTENFSVSTGESDIITFGSGINQNTTGNYRLSATLSSANDANTTNNSVDFDYVISDTEYGYADKNNLTSSYTLHENPLASNGDAVGIATYFPAPSGDPYVLSSITTYIADDYTGVINNGNGMIVGVVYPKNTSTGEWDISNVVMQTNPLGLANGDINTFLTLDLNTPLEITTEKEYLIAIHIFNNEDATDDGRISLGADPDKSAPNDLACIQIIGGSTVSSDFTPAIWANVEPAANPANTEANITAYSIPGQITSDINAGSQTISISMPGGTDLSNLIASFALSSGATVAISGIQQESGVTPNDFSNPVVYTVTAEDGTTTKNWTVNIDASYSIEANIEGYSINGQTSSDIDAGAQAINVTVPAGEAVTNLVATFTLSSGASAKIAGTTQESGITTNDFTSPLTYTVTAEDGTTTKNWTVTVTKDASAEAEITSYSIAGQTNSNIDAGAQTIDVTVPAGTAVANLVATFTLSSGASAEIAGISQESGVTTNDFTSPLTYTITAEDGTTTKNWTITVTESASAEVEITAYSIAGQSNSIIDAGAQTIDVTVPIGTDVTNLVATFTLSTGASAEIAGISQESGVTANDFTSPLTYTVTAENGTTTKIWTVTVTEGTSSAAEITAYSIAGQSNSNIDAGAQTIDVTVPVGTDVTNLVATFTLSTGASAEIDGISQESGVTANDFTSPLTYIVTAEDGTTTKNWTITVTESASAEAEITTYSIAGQTNSNIDAGAQTIDVTVPIGTDVTNLVATFTLSTGASAEITGISQESGVTVNDFTSPLTYTVTAENGTTTKNWTVTVTEGASSAAEITTYSIAGQTNSNIDAGAQTIDVTVPVGTDLTSLVATFTLSTGASAEIAGTSQESGVTANDFTSPLTYTVTAENGTTTKNWVVTITEQTGNSTDFISFSIDGNEGEIDLNNAFIRVEMPGGTDLTQLIADFEVVDGTTVKIGTTVQESGTTMNDFGNIVEYKLYPQSGASRKWYIQVVEQSSMSSSADFQYFGFYGQTQPAEIDAQSQFISINLDPSLSQSALMPIFYLSDGATAYIGNTIQWSGQNVIDFSSGVSYSIVAEDGVTTKIWTIQVTSNQNAAAEILAFSFASIPDNFELITINEGTKSINIKIPSGTPRNALVAEYQLSPGATAEISGIEQFSGVTENNFSSPLIYTIVSQNGNIEENWIINVGYQVGIDEGSILSVNVYPNPAIENMTIELSLLEGPVNLNIVNMLGQTVYNQQINTIKTNIDITPFRKGAYFIVLSNQKQKWVEKLIIK